jgi:hypothetical protein
MQHARGSIFAGLRDGAKLTLAATSGKKIGGGL